MQMLRTNRAMPICEESFRQALPCNYYAIIIYKPNQSEAMESNPNSIMVPIFLSLSREHAWDLLWRPEGQKQWMGSESEIRLNKNCRVTLCDDSGPWRDALLLECTHLQKVEFRVKLNPDWGSSGSTNLSIEIADSNQQSECVVIIKEYQIPLVCRPFIIDYWDRRRRHLERIDNQIKKRRENPRQAVILVHGIGEQQPGQMLYSFLESGVLGKNAARAWIKPDYLSKSFELRTATLDADKLRPTTQVYVGLPEKWKIASAAVDLSC